MSQNDPSQTELVFGLVSAVGTNLDTVVTILTDYLRQFGYSVDSIKLTQFLQQIELETQLKKTPEADRISSYMDGGNEARLTEERGDILALHAINDIRARRDENAPTPAVATVRLLRSLKHPDEVALLRRVYGVGFFLIAIYSSDERRLSYLTKVRGIPDDAASKLMDRDQAEENRAGEKTKKEVKFGQQTRKTFHLADVFIDVDASDADRQLQRFVDLVFGKVVEAPTCDEFSMYMAYSASLRSADLSRQVGAVINSADGDLISVGANDVPRFGGGLYWTGDHPDGRDFKHLECDSNHKKRDEIVADIIQRLGLKEPEKARQQLEGSPIFDITEFVRAIHAEMEAILACTRSGVSPRGGTLFCTTFPCHNCAKHIVGCGLRRVVYIEPYPKSQAITLHDDSITLDRQCAEKKVIFEPFVGVGPRRFFDFFSTTLGSGRKLERKDDTTGRVLGWEKPNAAPRIPMLPSSYLEREGAVAEYFKEPEVKNVTEEKKA